ncbi:hypothetical protein HBN50_04205 [Halobacteriovorax sp. GB3]|uniref:hypothetical protein n=1 Tax=Halobacteriovorax sp. GB3 TaxID=2719615 RepID=UPI00235E62DE|nr:hypothetical protein [Halobacteriovorax sp. GB3]MDD0852284.1 hypothetical protein [Halobacteriovorax sp. GB3]
MRLLILTAFLITFPCLSIEQKHSRDSKENKYETKEQIDAFFRFENEPKISSEYRRGQFLIYDCKKKSFICVDKDSFELCKSKRLEMRELKSRHLSCAPLKDFKDQKVCFDNQLDNIYRARIKTYCYTRKKRLNL